MAVAPPPRPSPSHFRQLPEKAARIGLEPGRAASALPDAAASRRAVRRGTTRRSSAAALAARRPRIAPLPPSRPTNARADGDQLKFEPAPLSPHWPSFEADVPARP